MCDRTILQVRRSTPIMEAIWYEDYSQGFREICQWIYRKGNFEIFLIRDEGLKIIGHGKEMTVLNETWIVYDDSEGFMAYRNDLFEEMFEEDHKLALD